MWSTSGVVIITTVVLSAVGGVRGDGPTPTYGQAPSYQSPNYAYQYAVKDDYFGVDFSAGETRQADETEGSYKVLLPDGRVQNVVYKVVGPEGGYIVDVVYDGEAKPYVAPAKPAYKSYAPAPAPAPAAPAVKAAPAPAPAPYKPAPAPAYKPAPSPAPVAYKPSPYKAFPKLQEATSYKSRIVFTGAAKAAAAEEDRSPKALADSGVAINEIPDVDIVKESRTEPVPVTPTPVVVQPATAAPLVEEESRRRSTTPPTATTFPLEEATLVPTQQQPVEEEDPTPLAPAPIPRSTTLPPITLVETTTAAAASVEPLVISTTAEPVFVEVTEAETVPATSVTPRFVAETTTAPAAVETEAPATTVQEAITTEASEAIQAEAESDAESSNNARRFAKVRQYKHRRPVVSSFASAPSYPSFPSYPNFSSFSQRSLQVEPANLRPVAAAPAPVGPVYSLPSSPQIFYGNWVPVVY